MRDRLPERVPIAARSRIGAFSSRGPVSAPQHFVPQRARDDTLDYPRIVFSAACVPAFSKLVSLITVTILAPISTKAFARSAVPA